MMKAVGMNIVLEGLALYSFRDMRAQTREPLLEQILTYVGRDEARHTAYGIKYLSHLTPQISKTECAELEDFAYEAARQLIDQRSGVSMRQTMAGLWADAGLDPMEAIGSVVKDPEFLKHSMKLRGGQMGPVHGFVVPTLSAVGLYSDRIRGHFKEMWSANIGAEIAEQMATTDVALPTDLEEWINQGYESL
jgi:hypothetical protein